MKKIEGILFGMALMLFALVLVLYYYFGYIQSAFIEVLIYVVPFIGIIVTLFSYFRKQE